MYRLFSGERPDAESAARDVWTCRDCILFAWLIAFPLFCAITRQAVAEDARADATAESPITGPRVEAQFRRMIEELVDAATSRSNDKQHAYAAEAGLAIGEYYARTPWGGECFRQMLFDPRPARGRFAAIVLSSSGDFANVRPLLAFAERHAEDEDLFGIACSLIHDTGATGLYSFAWDAGSVSNRERVKRMREVLDGRSERGPMPKSFEEFWGTRLAKALQDLARTGNWQHYQVGVFEADSKLQLSGDSRKAASYLITCLRELKEPHYELWIPTRLVMSLQLHVGPLDHPELKDGSVSEKKAAVRKVLEWWKQNSEKRPVEWMLGRLALRGYATAKPEDVKTTADALVSALAKGKPPERYAATRILAWVLPDGGALPAVYEDVVGDCEPLNRFALSQDSRNRANARYSCLDLVLARATRWAAWECALYSWNGREGRYEKRCDNGGTHAH